MQNILFFHKTHLVTSFNDKSMTVEHSLTTYIPTYIQTHNVATCSLSKCIAMTSLMKKCRHMKNGRNLMAVAQAERLFSSKGLTTVQLQYKVLKNSKIVDLYTKHGIKC